MKLKQFIEQVVPLIKRYNIYISTDEVVQHLLLLTEDVIDNCQLEISEIFLDYEGDLIIEMR